MFKFLLIILGLFFGAKLAASQISTVTNDECGKSKQCFFKPDDCDPSSDCFIGVTYTKTDETMMTFELFARTTSTAGQYVALGLSKDESMGDDGITECVHDGTTTSLYLSYTTSRSRPTRLNLPTNQVAELISGGMVNGYLVCKFRQLILPPGTSERIFPLDQNYNLLLAAGDASSSGIQKHDRYGTSRGPVVSGKVTVTDQKSVGSASSYLSPETKSALKKAHGICMVFGWFLFVASAILFARYCKKLWPNTKVAGKGLWFQMHRGLNTAGVVIIATGFVCIFVAEKGKWEGPVAGVDDFSNLQPESVHSVLGLTASIVAFLQPIVALMRCHPGDAKRPIFNWIHRFLGISGWCIAATTIWWATNFEGLGLHSKDNGIAPRAVIIFYWVALFVAVLVMEIHIMVTEWCRKPKTQQEVPLQPLSPGKHLPPPQTDNGPKFGIIRTLLLIFFVLVALGVTIALASLIGLA